MLVGAVVEEVAAGVKVPAGVKLPGEEVDEVEEALLRRRCEVNQRGEDRVRGVRRRRSLRVVARARGRAPRRCRRRGRRAWSLSWRGSPRAWSSRMFVVDVAVDGVRRRGVFCRGVLAAVVAGRCRRVGAASSGYMATEKRLPVHHGRPGDRRPGDDTDRRRGSNSV